MRSEPRMTLGPDVAAITPPRRVQPTPDLEDEADEFEEHLAAELIRRGVIERWG